MAKDRNKAWFSRLGLILVAIVLLTPALGTAWRHRLFYENFWGQPVFVPIALLVVLFLLCLVIFRWNKLRDFGQKSEKRKH